MSDKRFYIPREEGTKDKIIKALGESADPIDQGGYLLVSQSEAQASGVRASEWIFSHFDTASQPPNVLRQKPPKAKGHLTLVVDNSLDFDR